MKNEEVLDYEFKHKRERKWKESDYGEYGEYPRSKRFSKRNK